MVEQAERRPPLRTLGAGSAGRLEPLLSSRAGRTARLRRHLRAPLEVTFFALPVLIAPMLIVEYLIGTYHLRPITVDGTTFPDGGFLFDLHVLWSAGHAIATGHSPYPFVYPAPAAFLMVPFGALPWNVAVVAFAFFVAGALFLTLRLLGVRDWRCYALALGSMPATASVTTGTLSTLIALGAAVAWRYRDRRWAVAIAIAAVVVTKVFLWPLVIWLVATRRFRAAATSVATGVVLVFGFWAMLGFDGLREYPHLLGHIAGLEQARSYSPFALMQSLGMSTASAHLALIGLTALAALAILAVARGADGDRRAFVAALAAGLALSPIVWLHYFVLIYVVIAVYRRRFGVAWMVPALYWVLPGQDSHGSARVILAAYGMTAVALAVAIYRRQDSPGPVPAPR